MESIVLQESRSPLYQQVYAKLTAEIQSGALAAGEKLPAKRRLAADLHITEGQAGQGISVSGAFALITSLLIASIAA
ncbi:MAG: GntR family transcriptional regulator, partial [Ruthenibacterium sp.]